MKHLVRTKAGSFCIGDAMKLAQIEQLFLTHQLEKQLITIDSMFQHYTKLNVAREYHKLIYNGNPFRREQITTQMENPTADWVRVYDADNLFVGIYQFDFEKNYYWPIKMFL
jgi:tRNA pseudouridine55 synthase